MLDPDKVHPVEFAADSGCNTTDDVIKAHVRANIRRGLPQVMPFAPNPATAVIVCGGPSIEEKKNEIAQAQWAGGKIVAVNGTYDWCLKNNIRPSAAIMIDAREFNKRFFEAPVEGCKYLIASQCHPSTFDMLRGRNVWIWHACSGGDEEYKLLEEYYFGRTHPVTLGTTVGVRAISLMRMLGFTRQQIFGLDSCWMDAKHHGYDQPENNADLRVAVWLRPKGLDGEHRDDKAHRFICAPWHIKQALDFLELMKTRGDMFDLAVEGDGLIATMLRVGAELQWESDKDVVVREALETK